VNGLDGEAFVDPSHFTALCAPNTMAAVGATVSLDGGPGLAVDGDGFVALPPVGVGSHALDVAGPGLYEPAAELVDLAVYPGVRVAIAVDPVPDEPGDPTGGGETTNGETTNGGGETGGGETGNGEAGGETGVGEVGGPDGTGEAPTSGSGAPTSDGPGEGGGPDEGGSDDEGGGSAGAPSLTGAALPDGYGQYGDEGCGCRSSSGWSGGWLGLLVLGGLGRRRRRS
jgi:MYXO-CTERM domain-containing protein